MLCNERFVLIDREGYPMAVCTGEHVEKAIAKGHVARTDNPKVVQVTAG